MWIIFAASSLLASITGIILGMVVYIRDKNNIVNIKFGIISILIGIWAMFPFLTAVIENQQIQLLVGRITYLAAFFAPSAFFDFVFTFLNIKNNGRLRKAINISYLISVAFMAISFSPLFIKGIVSRAPNSFVIAGPLFPLFILFFSAFCPYAIYQIYQKYKSAYGFRREQLKFLFLGFLIALIGGSVHLLAPYINIEYIPHDFFLLCWSIVITYAIVKYNLLDIRIVLTRAGIFLLLYAAVLGLPFYIGFNTHSWLLPTVSMFILSSLGPEIYRYFQKKAMQILLAEQKRYQDILINASEGMVHQHDMNKLIQLTVYLIRRYVKTSYAAGYLYDQDGGNYVLKSIRQNAENPLPDKIAENSKLIKFLALRKSPVIFEELPLEIIDVFSSDLDIGLIIPAIINDSFLGILILGHKQNKTIYSEDDIKVFKTLSNQAALAILNCIFTERAKKDQELMLHSEKLALIGGMAAGVAHQFRNRLGQFNAVHINMDFDLEDLNSTIPEYLKTAPPEILKYIELNKEKSAEIAANVKRTTEIINGVMILSTMKQSGITHHKMSLNDMVSQAVSMIEVKHSVGAGKMYPVNLNFQENDILYGDTVRLFESVYNCIDNAYEAIEEKIDHYLKPEEVAEFKPSINITLTHKDRTTLVVIEDNGIGIKDEDKKKIFAPFYTSKPSSKKSGSGIGSYFVKMSIEEYHKGRIWFESEHTKGTKFYIEIPKYVPDQNEPICRGFL